MQNFVCTQSIQHMAEYTILSNINTADSYAIMQKQTKVGNVN